MLYQPALALDRPPATAGVRRDLRTRLLAGAVVAAAGVFVVYLFAVRTRWGQDFENAALAGARQHRGGTWYEDADRWLGRITAESFVLSVAVIGVVGVLRRRYLLALCGVLTAGGAVLGARFLKGALPARPVLGAADAHAALHAANALPAANGLPAANTLHTANTLPSGHTAAAMGLFFAALIVASRKWYVPITLLALPGAALSGVATVAAHWHRLSDTLAADLVALAAGLLGLAAVAQLGLVQPARVYRRSPLGQRLLYLALVVLATGALAVGAGYTLHYRGAAGSGSRADAAYWAAQAFALGAAIVTAGMMLAVCRRLETVDRYAVRGVSFPRP